MAELAIEAKNLLLERIIMTIKRYGEPVLDGYKIDFAVFAKELPKDEMVASNQTIKEILVTESSIFGFFKGQDKMQVQLISEGKKHCLYLKPKGTLSSKSIKEEAKTIIYDLTKENKRLSYKKVYEELSRRIVFFEYHLRRMNVPVKEYIQQLLPPSNMKAGEQGYVSPEETVIEDAEEKSNEPELSAEETENRVRKDILSILEQQGIVSSGYRQMILGMLCNALADRSTAYQTARGSYHGPARSFLLDRFGDLLSIEYLDGKDWARVPLTAFSEKKDIAKAEMPKEKLAPEAKPVPPVELFPATESSVSMGESVSFAKEIKTSKTTKTTTKKKETATEMLIRELSDLSDEELDQFLLVVQLAHVTFGNAAFKTGKKTEYAVNKNETSAVMEIAAKVGINAQAVLAKNETMNKITAHLTTGEIIEIIIEETRLRKGVLGELSGTETDKKTKGEAKITPQYKPEIMTDADYEGLDDWLPF